MPRAVPAPVPAPASPPRLAKVHRLPLSGADDAVLARALMAGDEAAATVVWERYSPLVRGILRRSLGPYADVEDAVQDVFLGFFRRVGGLEDPGALRSFLIGISVHVAVSALRRRRVRRWLRLTDSGVVPEVAVEAGGGDQAREAMARLYAILDRLDDAGRLTFVLRYVEGLELTEVAAALSVSLATAKRRLSKVTARVLVMIEGDPVLPDYARAMLAGREGRGGE